MFGPVLAQARARTDELFQSVSPGALYDRPIPERHRLIFYLGHLEAFDWNLIWHGSLGRAAFDPEFDRLFSFGIDPAPGQLPQDEPSDWPSEHQVRAYNTRVRLALDEVAELAPAQLMHVAIEHRLMHAETLSYLLHDLPFEKKARCASPVFPPGPARPIRILEIPAGQVTLGRNAGDGFGWDNEFEAHVVDVPRFAMSKYKVTNGDYLEFVRAGAEAPHFWKSRGNEWSYRGMFADIPLPLDWPVYVTHRQATAYAAWLGKCLPTEAQFHRAAYGTLNEAQRSYPWGEEAPDPGRGNFDFCRWDPIPVSAFPRGDSAFGVSQLLGNGWEWTSTRFSPFAGFQPFPFYPGYSANFFDGEHYVLKGGSPRTAARMLRRSFRNWFRPDYPYAYAGFRLVEN